MRILVRIVLLLLLLVVVAACGLCFPFLLLADTFRLVALLGGGAAVAGACCLAVAVACSQGCITSRILLSGGHLQVSRSSHCNLAVCAAVAVAASLAGVSCSAVGGSALIASFWCDCRPPFTASLSGSLAPRVARRLVIDVAAGCVALPTNCT